MKLLSISQQKVVGTASQQPAAVVVTEVQEVYTQCAKAIMRSGLWDGAPLPDGLPTVGDIMAEMTSGEIGGPDYDREYEARAIPRMW